MNPVSELTQLLSPLFALFGENAWLRAFAVLLIGYLAALLIDRLLIRLLKRLSHKTRSPLDDQLVAFLSGPLFQSIVLLSIATAASALKLSETLQNTLTALLQSYAVLIWSLFLVRFARSILRRMARNPSRFALLRNQTLPLFENIAIVLVLGLAIYLIFSAWHIDMTAWLASAGIIGIAVGFAAKDTLSNLFSGVFILADAPYKIGDYIVLDSGERGEVTHIGIRSTRILTRDDVEVTIPNAIMGNTKILNESGGPHTKFRIRVKVGVAYGSDIDQVREVLLAIAGDEQGVCEDPLPRVRFRAFGGSSLDFELLCWVEEPMLRGRIVDALNSTIYKRFIAEGVEIPYSKHDLYIKEWPAQPPVAPGE
jgi:MscS family membrane protein